MNIKPIILLSGLAFCCFDSKAIYGQDKVKTTNGWVSGTLNGEDDVQEFKGVPYARPPVGELRWKEPQPVFPWKGVLKCDSYGPNAMQPRPIPSWAYGPEILIPTNGRISEDCLYLNVWAPVHSAGKKLPVIVIIHGGGFTGGSGSVAVLDGEQTAKKGVVVVSINYRLGIFGFLAHPALSAESPHHVSGNYGILDQVAALKWVKQNIAAFGGDPDNITADGGSAGSCCIHVMIASPLGKGLFRRAISESGPLFKTNVCPHLKAAEEEGLLTMQSKHANDLAAMRAIPAEELVLNDHRREPVIDGYVLPDELINIFKSGRQNDVDLLIGYNEGDDAMESAPVNASNYKADMEKKYGAGAAEVLKLYPAGSDNEAAQSQRRQTRDLVFAFESYTWAKWQVNHGKRKAWFFYFSHGAPGRPWFGAFHGSQSAYALANLGKWNRPFQDWDRTLSNSMNAYWINFAATGDPNGKGLPDWPAFRPTKTQVIGFGDQVKTIDLPAMPAFHLFESIGAL